MWVHVRISHKIRFARTEASLRGRMSVFERSSGSWMEGGSTWALASPAAGLARNRPRRRLEKLQVCEKLYTVPQNCWKSGGQSCARAGELRAILYSSVGQKFRARSGTEAPADRMEAPADRKEAPPKPSPPPKTKSTPTAGPPVDAAPLDYFESILKDSPHGTSNATTRFQATHFWWTDPTPRQLADYDSELAAAARSDDVEALEKAVSSGRCLDARNKYGESLVHAACYGSAPRALAYILRQGGSLKGCDATGRTPLHYACSARTPCFEIALQILAREPRQAHAFDARGKRALSSVPDQNRRAWCEFIYANRRALRGLASPEPRLVPPRVASPPPLSTVAPPPAPSLPKKTPMTSGEAIMRLMPSSHGDKSPGLADVSPLIASMPRVDSRATVGEPDQKPQKALQIDSGAAARAISTIGKHAKGRAASPPPLRTSPATRLRETSGASKKHDRDAASDEDDHNRESKRAEPDSSGESAVRLGLPDPSPPFDASPAVRTLDHTPSLASRVRS